jgi:hypothetical protein
MKRVILSLSFVLLMITALSVMDVGPPIIHNAAQQEMVMDCQLDVDMNIITQIEAQPVFLINEAEVEISFGDLYGLTLIDNEANKCNSAMFTNTTYDSSGGANMIKGINTDYLKKAGIEVTHSYNNGDSQSSLYEDNGCLQHLKKGGSVIYSVSTSDIYNTANLMGLFPILSYKYKDNNFKCDFDFSMNKLLVM